MTIKRNINDLDVRPRKPRRRYEMNEETIDAEDRAAFNAMLDEQAPLIYQAWIMGMETSDEAK